MILLYLDLEKVNDLCNICDMAPFDVSVISSNAIVDGSSVMGVMGLCDRTVELKPVTTNTIKITEFYKKVKPLGAYFSKE